MQLYLWINKWKQLFVSNAKLAMKLSEMISFSIVILVENKFVQIVDIKREYVDAMMRIY